MILSSFPIIIKFNIFLIKKNRGVLKIDIKLVADRVWGKGTIGTNYKKKKNSC